MSYWKIAWRNIQQRGLASVLTAFSMALGVAVMIAVMVIYAVTVEQFKQSAQGYNYIVGGKGGALQLVLSTVYHIGQPLYPIPYTYYQKFLPGGEFADSVEVAIPQCLGDSYQAPNGTMFRVVGTTPDLFDKIEYGRLPNGTPLRYEFQGNGKNLRDASQLHGHAFHDAAFEAVIGSIVAAQAKLKLGDEIYPTHGIGGDGHKHDGFKIVGILKPTGTANDRAVFINIEGFYRLEGHALADEEAAEDEATSEQHAPPNARSEKAHERHEEREEEHEQEHLDEDQKQDVTGAETVKDQETHAHEGHAHEGEADEHSKDKHSEDVHHTGEGDQKVSGGHEHETHEHEAHGDEAHGDEAHEHNEHGHDAHAGHEHDHGHVDEPLPIDQREVTSILVLCKENPLFAMTLDMGINKGKDRIAQAVAPMREIDILLKSIVGPVQVVLLVLTILIIVVASVSILVSIYNSMSERSHDIAVMRALGASRSAVMAIVFIESILLAVGGGLFGMLLGHGLLGLASPYVLERTGIVLSSFAFDWQELLLIPGLMLLASIVGFLPALTAYRTDVAKSLSGSR